MIEILGREGLSRVSGLSGASGMGNYMRDYNYFDVGTANDL
jgi:hypothetical protein